MNPVRLFSWVGALFFVLAFPRAGAQNYENRLLLLPCKGYLPEVEPGTFVYAGDYTGDGRPEAVFSDGLNSLLYKNDGNGRFEYLAKLRGGMALAPGDFDGDGDTDLFLLGRTYSRGFLYANDGKGGFKDVTQGRVPRNDSWCQGLVTADLDGDGDLDLVIYPSSSSNKGSIFLNDGKGSFSDGTAGRTPENLWAFHVIAADFDGDKDIDLLLLRGKYLVLWMNDGKGHFKDSSSGLVQVPGMFTAGGCAGDVDGDGDIDVFLACGSAWGPQGNQLWLNDGKGKFTNASASRLPAYSGRSYLASMGDIDGDGDLDIVFRDTRAGIWVLLNDGKGKFAFPPGFRAILPRYLSFAYGHKGLALADIEGDGDLDLFTQTDRLSPSLFLNLGGSRFIRGGRFRVPPLPFDYPRCVDAGDVDGDGDVDLVFGERNLQDRLYLNDGQGVFVDSTKGRMPALFEKTRALKFADVDGDGDMDLFEGPEYGFLKLFLNDGKGFFKDVSSVNLPNHWCYPWSFSTGDVDGDGDVDLVIANDSHQTNSLLINDGKGKFTDETVKRLPYHPDDTRRVLLGDFDGDGDLDIFSVNCGSECRVYLNDGKGFFKDSPSSFKKTISGYFFAGALGDLDGDGDPDVVVGGMSGLGCGVLRNDKGVFSLAGGVFIPGLRHDTRDIALLDFNHDGLPDIVLGTTPRYMNESSPNVLLVNMGNCRFANGQGRWLQPKSMETWALKAADFDGDGDTDLAAMNRYSAPQIYFSLQRQVFSPLYPARGRSFEVRFYGREGQSVLPLLGFAEGRHPLPPYGIFRMDLNSFVGMPMVSIPSNSVMAGMSLMVPRDPVLAGGKIYLQGLVVDPKKPELTHFTSLDKEIIQ